MQLNDAMLWGHACTQTGDWRAITMHERSHCVDPEHFNISGARHWTTEVSDRMTRRY